MNHFKNPKAALASVMARRPVLFLGIVSIFTGLYLLFVNIYVQPPSASEIDKAYLLREERLRSQVDETARKTRILLVSALFPLEKAKHSHEEYNEWLRLFLQPITTDIYFYTTPELADIVRTARGAEHSIAINTSYNSPFDIPPLRGLKSKYFEMQKKDREGDIHSPELYAVWTGKAFFLDQAVRNLALKGKKYEYAFWNDAGSFRVDHKYKDWPDRKRIEQIWNEGSRLSGTKKSDLLFFPISEIPNSTTRYWAEDDGPLDQNFSEGSFFGGSPQAISWWSQVYFAYHNYYLSLGHFVGKDQTLYNALFLLFPERFFTVWVKNPDAVARKGRVYALDHSNLGHCGNEWYYYQFWLASEMTRKEMRDLWAESFEELEKPGKWVQTLSSWKWWRDRQACRLTEVLPIRNILSKKLGYRWRPPAHSNLVLRP